jgi:hypothetical protein
MSESISSSHDVTSDTIVEGKVLNTNNIGNSPLESESHHEHFLHYLTLPNRRVRTLSE